jgi:hypothetical protein
MNATIAAGKPVEAAREKRATDGHTVRFETRGYVCLRKSQRPNAVRVLRDVGALGYVERRPGSQIKTSEREVIRVVRRLGAPDLTLASQAEGEAPRLPLFERVGVDRFTGCSPHGSISTVQV